MTIHNEQYSPTNESVEPSPQNEGCKTIEPTEAERLDHELSRMVTEVFDVEPHRLTIRTFPGNHVITDELTELLECGEFDALYGEMNINNILERLNPPQNKPVKTPPAPSSWQRFKQRLNIMKYPSVGTSSYEKEMDARNMRRLFDNGIALVAGDANSEAFQKHYTIYEGVPYDVDRVNIVVYYTAGILVGLGAGELIIRIPEYVLQNWKPSRRKFLRFGVWGAASLAAYGLYRQLNTWYRQTEWVERGTPIGRNPRAELKAQRQTNFERIWYDTEPFGQFTEVLVPFRNRVMAQNFLSYIAGRLNSHEQKVNVAAYYGTLHGGIYDEIAKGASAVHQALAQDARRFLTKTYPFVEAMFTKKTDDPEEEVKRKKIINRGVIDAFVDYAGMFAEQYSVDPTDYGLLWGQKNIPPTARTIFIDELKNEIGRLKDCGVDNRRDCKRLTLLEVENQLLRKKTETLLHITKTTGKEEIFFEQKVLRDPEITAAYAQTLAEYRTKKEHKIAQNDRLAIQYGFFLDHFSSGFSSELIKRYNFLGWGKVRGQYAPLVRETIDGDNGVISRDILLASAHERVILGEYHYEPIASLEEFETLLQEQPTYVYQYVSPTTNYWWIKDKDATLDYKQGNFYKLKPGKADPFEVHIVEVFRPGQNTDWYWENGYRP